MDIENKKIILGVCGGIAAYKSVVLARELIRQKADVRVIMTRNARAFVGELTFAALSGQPVFTDLFDRKDASIRHIDWAREADAVIIAPATANMIAKLAAGIADDALSTFMLAVTSPILLCPSMNTNMYASRSVQRNLATLKADGWGVIEPEAGELACGTTGPGRLPDPLHIANRLLALLTPKDLCNKKVLVTAGPTREYFDPVRFVSNPSTGKMGYAIAKAAERRGAQVVLVAGPTVLSDPVNVRLLKIETAEEMYSAVMEQAEDADVIIKAAAVSDYKAKITKVHKIKKDVEEKTLAVCANPDILKSLGKMKDGRFLVGFAAETQDLQRNARLKLEAKNLDMIVANLVGTANSGFAADTNQVVFFYRDGTQEALASMTKDAVADLLIDRIITHMGKGLHP
jgi:phosphopantothenoylcysteine decarboxylase/phosphopantothenate--cysteine ligase